MDFTLKRYRELLAELKNAGFRSVMPDMVNNSGDGRFVVLRHDVDRNPKNSLATAIIEYELGFSGIYYFRIIPASLDRGILLRISELGHEIGYHYEDMATARGDVELAYSMFRHNLGRLREDYPVKHCCMHGSPLSKHDNRFLWMKYDYRSSGIIFEPYFDTDLSNTLYLTDTGRRWDGSKFIIRDKPASKSFTGISRNREEPGKSTGSNEITKWASAPRDGSMIKPTENSIEFQSRWSFRSTPEIINSIRENNFPERVSFTIHPQRWNNSLSRWMIELVSQRIKNGIKYLLLKRG